MRVAIFYTINGHERGEFDGMRGRDIIEQLDKEYAKMGDEDAEPNAHIYCLDADNPEQLPDLQDFEQDYNDGIIDATEEAWWCQIAEY